MLHLDMVTFTTVAPPVVNGLFAVPKGPSEQRLIVDARPANALFAPPADAAMPTPDLAAGLELDEEAARPLHAAKVDLSNFYHQLRLPAWLHPYFALPSIRAGDLDLGQRFGGANVRVWPCCTSLPMGWSHSVYVAQRVHEHLAHSVGGLAATDAITTTSDRRLDRCRHLLYIDDLILFGHDPATLLHLQQQYVEGMQRFGLPVKSAKVVPPTCDGMEALGMYIDGRRRTIGVAAHKRYELVQRTERTLRRGWCSGLELSALIGSWTWTGLVRRPVLSVFSSVYRFINCAGRRVYWLWPSVRRELNIILGLAPLMIARFSPPCFPAVVAVDASGTGSGVVAHTASPSQQKRLSAGLVATELPRQESRPADSSERNPVDPVDDGSGDDDRPSSTENLDGDVRARTCRRVEALFGSAFASAHFRRQRSADIEWDVIAGARWFFREHINVLEARAALAAANWFCRHPGTAGTRVLLLSDSSVVTSALRKGRSSSYPLLRIIRRISALLLATGITIEVRWIPSEVNPADGVSRWRWY
jgi:hypothetical protein